ncbi:MAG: acyltransferase, partial [Burkholderiales bacterium]|nr:acyltransferase [Burkholderiales bacterium]
ILGSASYPMYVLHLPLAQMAHFVARNRVEQFAPLSGILLVIFLLWISLLVEKEYDIPLRRWLTQKFNRPKNRSQP